jgi:hypothetical protein
MLAVSVAPLQATAAQRNATTVVQAEGMSAITEGDSASARTAAIDAALRSAVNGVVAAFIPEDSAVTDRDRIREALYAKWRDYIQEFRILAESALDNRYRVILSVTVLSGKIEDSFEKLNPSRVCVVLVEKGVERYEAMHGKAPLVTICETSLRTSVQKEGFAAVGLPEYSRRPEGPEISPEQAAHLGGSPRRRSRSSALSGAAWRAHRFRPELFHIFLVQDAVRVHNETPIATYGRRCGGAERRRTGGAE